MTEHGEDARRRTVTWDDPAPSAEARSTDAAGELYAHAVGTCLVVTAR